MFAETLVPDVDKEKRVKGFATVEDQGGRPDMQDRSKVVEKFVNENGFYALVADGHGAGGGEIAQMVADNLDGDISKLIKDDGMEPKEAIKKGFLDLDEKIQSKIKAGDIENGGSTGSILITQEKKLYVGSAGDSQVVLARKGEGGRFLTKKHIASDAEEVARVIANGGTVTPDARGTMRVNGEIMVTRSFGDSADAKGKGITAEPDIGEFDLDGKEEFAIVASDGLWDYTTDVQAVASVRETLGKGGTITDAVNKLKDITIAKGGTGRDNLTITIIEFKHPKEVSDKVDAQEFLRQHPKIAEFAKKKGWSPEVTQAKLAELKAKIESKVEAKAGKNINSIPETDLNNWKNQLEQSKNALPEDAYKIVALIFRGKIDARNRLVTSYTSALQNEGWDVAELKELAKAIKPGLLDHLENTGRWLMSGPKKLLSGFKQWAGDAWNKIFGKKEKEAPVDAEAVKAEKFITAFKSVNDKLLPFINTNPKPGSIDTISQSTIDSYAQEYKDRDIVTMGPDGQPVPRADDTFKIVALLVTGYFKEDTQAVIDKHKAQLEENKWNIADLARVINRLGYKLEVPTEAAKAEQGTPPLERYQERFDAIKKKFEENIKLPWDTVAASPQLQEKLKAYTEGTLPPADVDFIAVLLVEGLIQNDDTFKSHADALKAVGWNIDELVAVAQEKNKPQEKKEEEGTVWERTQKGFLKGIKAMYAAAGRFVRNPIKSTKETASKLKEIFIDARWEAAKAANVKRMEQFKQTIGNASVDGVKITDLIQDAQDNEKIAAEHQAILDKLMSQYNTDMTTLSGAELVALLLTDQIGLDHKIRTGEYNQKIKESGIDLDEITKFKKQKWREYLTEGKTYTDDWRGKAHRFLANANIDLFETLQKLSPLSVAIDKFGRYNSTGYDKKEVGWKDVLNRNFNARLRLSKDGRDAAWYLTYVPSMALSTLGMGGIARSIKAGLSLTSFGIDNVNKVYNTQSKEFWQEFAEKGASNAAAVKLMEAVSRVAGGKLKTAIEGAGAGVGIGLIADLALEYNMLWMRDAAGALQDTDAGQAIRNVGDQAKSAADNTRNNVSHWIDGQDAPKQFGDISEKPVEAPAAELINPGDQDWNTGPVEGSDGSTTESGSTLTNDGTDPILGENPRPNEVPVEAVSSSQYLDITANKDLLQMEWNDANPIALANLDKLDWSKVGTIELEHGTAMWYIAERMQGDGVQQNMAELFRLNQDYFASELRNSAYNKVPNFNLKVAWMNQIIKDSLDTTGKLPDVATTTLPDGSNMAQTLNDLMGDVPAGLVVQIKE